MVKRDQPHSKKEMVISSFQPWYGYLSCKHSTIMPPFVPTLLGSLGRSVSNTLHDEYENMHTCMYTHTQYSTCACTCTQLYTVSLRPTHQRVVVNSTDTCIHVVLHGPHFFWNSKGHTGNRLTTPCPRQFHSDKIPVGIHLRFWVGTLSVSLLEQARHPLH